MADTSPRDETVATSDPFDEFAEPPASMIASARRTLDGLPLTAGVNVDRVDIGAGLARAVQLGYDSPIHEMVVTYALQRHARGEEDGAVRTALAAEGLNSDLTSWYAILAAAVTAAEAADAVAVEGAQPVTA